MVQLLLYAVLLQAGSADSPEELVRRSLESTDAGVANDARNKLQAKGAAGQKAIREALKARYQGRADLVPPGDLVRRLDAAAVLDLQDLGADAVDALEEALRSAEGDRKAVIRRLLNGIQQKERESRSMRPDPLFYLTNIMSATKVAGDEMILLKILMYEQSSFVQDRVVNQLKDHTFTGESLTALLSAVDLRPASVGRPMWPLLVLQVREVRDWQELLKKGGPWSRALAAFRLKDPAVLESVMENASSTIRLGILSTLTNYPMDAEARPAFLTRMLTKAAQDPSESVRSAVATALQQNNLDAADLLFTLLLNEADHGRERLIDLARRCKSPPSEAVLRQVLETGRSDLIPKLSPFLIPGRYAGLVPLVVAGYEKSDPRIRRQIALILARYDHEIGVRQIESDLKSSNTMDIQSALNEITRYRMTRHAARLWALTQDPNGQVAAMVRPAAVLLNAADHPAEIQTMLSADELLRENVARILRETGGSADLPLVTALARSNHYYSQEAALSVLEGMQLTQMNDALAALRETPHALLRPRVDALLGKFEYPAKLPQILADLTVLDARKRSEAQQKYDRTDRKTIRFRIVEGPAAMKDNVVDVPVDTVRSLIADVPRVADDIFNNLVPGPVPAALADPAVLMRGGPGALISQLIRRGDKEDVRRLFSAGIKAAEAGPLAQHAREARAVDAAAVDAFFDGWLRNPPAGARREVIANILNQAVAALPEAQARDLLVAMFRDERPDVHQAPIDVVRKQPALAFPAEAAAAFRAGKIKEKHLLYGILGSVRSPEGEELLREWLKDPARPVRGQAAAALARLLKADAIPVIGDALHDWVALSRWWVLTELTAGIGPRHREALQAMAARANAEEQPIVDVLLYLSGVDALRNRFLSLFPEQDTDRRPFILALDQRPGTVDDALVESLLRIDAANRAPGVYLKLLAKSDTVKAAELAKFILENTIRQNFGHDSDYGSACELLIRRLPEPPFELIGHFMSGASEATVVRALAAVGTEPALLQLVRSAARHASPQGRELVIQSLRSARRFPAIQQELRGNLADSNARGGIGGMLATLAYLERDADSLEVVLKAMSAQAAASVQRLAALQTALTMPGSEAKVDAALLNIPRDAEGSEVLLPEVVRIMVKGGAVGALPQGEALPYRLLLASWARNREAVAKFVPSYHASYYALYRDLIETAANRPLPTHADALQWAKAPGGTPTAESMAAEMKALGIDDLRKALRDARPFIRANAAWILQNQQGRKHISFGPWIAFTPEPGGNARWVFPETPAREIEVLEQK